MARLDHLGVTFHAKLGTQGERVERIRRLAGEIADHLSRQPNFFDGKFLSADDLNREQDAYRKRVHRAAVLAKADLTTEVVGEFPELQGAMGRKYALLQGEHPSVAAAIEEHYKPQGPSDRVPTDPVSVAVALADKLDTLVGFWAIDEKPTGSKDPYALRRAALGVIRIVIENGVSVAAQTARSLRLSLIRKRRDRFPIWQISDNWELDLLAFFHDRLKVYLREQGARHDLIDAVLASGAAPSSALEADLGLPQAARGGHAAGERSDLDRHHPDPLRGSRAARAASRGGRPSSNDDLLMIVRRVEALGSFLDTEDGKNLLAGTKRAANILAAEEKKGTAIAASVDPALFRTPDEEALYAAVNQAEKEAGEAIGREDFSAAMRALSALREPVDSFFEHVLVNDEDASRARQSPGAAGAHPRRHRPGRRFLEDRRVDPRRRLAGAAFGPRQPMTRHSHAVAVDVDLDQRLAVDDRAARRLRSSRRPVRACAPAARAGRWCGTRRRPRRPDPHCRICASWRGPAAPSAPPCRADSRRSPGGPAPEMRAT